MHILLLPSESYLTPWAPLGGIFQQDLARALVAEGVSVGVLSVGKVPTSMTLRVPKYPALEVSEGVAVARGFGRMPLPQTLDPRLWLGAHYARLAAPLLSRYIAERGRPDLLHAHNVRYAAAIAHSLSARFGIPYVVTEHSTEYGRGAVPPRLHRPFRDLLEGAAGRSAVSAGLGRRIALMLGLPLGSIEVIPNILPAEFSEEPEVQSARRSGDGAPVFLNVAELVPRKAHAALLAAFAEAFAGTAAELRIVGGGALLDELRGLAVRLGVGDQVRFLGRQPRDRVRVEMDAADAFVLSSERETFGVVVIEAMSRGCPVITTASEGPEDLVGALDGLVVPVGDHVALANALRQVGHAPERFDRVRIAERCRMTFSAQSVARRYLDWYRRALRGIDVGDRS